MDNSINEPANSLNRTTILVIILIMSAALAGFFLYRSQKSAPPLEESSRTAHQIEVVDLPKAQNPAGIPQDLPLDPGSKVIQNYESTAPDGRIQSTKKFTTPLGVDEALAKYHKFFEARGWKRNVTGPLTSPLAYKGANGALMIVVNEDASQTGSEVEITVLQTQTTN